MTQARRLTVPGLPRLTPIRLDVGIIHDALAGTGTAHQVGQFRIVLPVDALAGILSENRLSLWVMACSTWTASASASSHPRW